MDAFLFMLGVSWALSGLLGEWIRGGTSGLALRGAILLGPINLLAALAEKKD